MEPDNKVTQIGVPKPLMEPDNKDTQSRIPEPLVKPDRNYALGSSNSQGTRVGFQNFPWNRT